jgi:hypothetical protein
MTKLSNYLLILMSTGSAVSKEFPKAVSVLKNGFPKATGNFMKKSSKMYLPRTDL